MEWLILGFIAYIVAAVCGIALAGAGLIMLVSKLFPDPDDDPAPR